MKFRVIELIINHHSDDDTAEITKRSRNDHLMVLWRIVFSAREGRQRGSSRCCNHGSLMEWK